MSTLASWSSFRRFKSDQKRPRTDHCSEWAVRIPALPDVPTFAEIGVANFTSDTWNALSAPPKTPPAIIAKINSAANDALKSADVQDRFSLR